MFTEDDIEWCYCVTRDEAGRVTDLSRARIIEWESPNAWEWFWYGDWANAVQIDYGYSRISSRSLITCGGEPSIADVWERFYTGPVGTWHLIPDMVSRYFRIFFGLDVSKVSIDQYTDVYITGPVSPEFRDEIQGAAYGTEYRLSVQTFDLESGEWETEVDDMQTFYSQSAIEKTLAEDYPLTEFPIEIVLPEFQS